MTTRADGARVHIRLSITPRLDADGRYLGAIAISTDITEQVVAAQSAATERRLAAKARTLAEQAAVLRDAAQRANRSKSEFLSRMSHELRTPLNAVIGFGQLLEVAELEEAEDRDSVDRILRAGRHLLDLINEVLDISRIETGDLHLSVEPVSILEAVQSAIDLIVPSAKQRAITIERRDPEDGQPYVLGDRQRLLQVILNLLSNAVKYNVEGGQIGVEVSRGLDGQVTVSVADTGLGLAPDEIDRLFVPFDRLGATNGDVEGTGVGLALSKGLVERMGGQLEVESTVGIGSTFRFHLRPADEPVTKFGVAPVAAVPTDVRPLVVLYIEDNLANYRVVEGMLALRPGVTLLPAMQGKIGLELARAHDPDLVLLDVHLPDMDGREVLQALRSDPATVGTQVVVVSADATEGQIQRMTAAGADQYLTKPFDLQRLLAVVDDLSAATT
jgi:signal transduction histidine kinase